VLANALKKSLLTGFQTVRAVNAVETAGVMPQTCFSRQTEISQITKAKCTGSSGFFPQLLRKQYVASPARVKNKFYVKK